MDDTRAVRQPFVAGWWSRLPDGGMKRIWVTRDGSLYRCRTEICTQPQEEARGRLFEALNQARAQRRPATSVASADAQVWAGATFAALETKSASEAWSFLGGDDVASCALLAADAMDHGEIDLRQQMES